MPGLSAVEERVVRVALSCRGHAGDYRRGYGFLGQVTVTRNVNRVLGLVRHLRAFRQVTVAPEVAEVTRGDGQPDDWYFLLVEVARAGQRIGRVDDLRIVLDVRVDLEGWVLDRIAQRRAGTEAEQK